MSAKQEKARRIAERIETGLPEEKWAPHWHWNDKVRDRIWKHILDIRHERTRLPSS